MKDWDDDFDEVPQSSRAGKRKTFDGLDDIVDDFNAESSSMPKTKKLKKVAATKKAAKPRGVPPPRENPEEPVRVSWAKVKPSEFKRDRLSFNPYVFGQPTCLDDSRFYCKMHQQIFHQRIAIQKNAHVPVDYFNLAQARDTWPDVMGMMDFHQITKIMTVSTPYSPALLQQFYATVVFTTEHGQRSMTWMSADTVCSATLAEFGALFSLEELPVAPCYVRLHLSKLIPAETGIDRKSVV